MGKTDWDAEEARWAQQIEAVVGRVRAWWTTYPRATFREIAAAVDAELNQVRAQLLGEAAMTSAATRFTEHSVPAAAHGPRRFTGRKRTLREESPCPAHRKAFASVGQCTFGGQGLMSDLVA
jgi:hypothetical protein